MLSLEEWFRGTVFNVMGVFDGRTNLAIERPLERISTSELGQKASEFEILFNLVVSSKRRWF